MFPLKLSFLLVLDYPFWLVSLHFNIMLLQCKAGQVENVIIRLMRGKVQVLHVVRSGVLMLSSGSFERTLFFHCFSNVWMIMVLTTLCWHYPHITKTLLKFSLVFLRQLSNTTWETSVLLLERLHEVLDLLHLQLPSFLVMLIPYFCNLFILSLI